MLDRYRHEAYDRRRWVVDRIRMIASPHKAGLERGTRSRVERRAMLRVVVATPLGQGGRGGIDRVMDDLRRQIVRDVPPGLNVSFLTTRGNRSIWFSPFFLICSITSLVALKLASRIDLLHINLSSYGSASRKMILARVARTLGVKYVVHLHGSRFRQFFEKASASKRRALTRMFECAERTFVLGEVWRAFLLEHVPAITGRVEIMPNASRSPARTSSREGPPRILFLGQIGPRKGVPQLVEALARIKQVGDWTATIAGNGDVAKTRTSIAAHGLSERVDVVDWLDSDAVETLLSSGHILVLPSHDENLPMSIIEGMAHGLAVVATPVGSVEEIVHHDVTGLIVPVGDSKALAAELERLLFDEQLRTRLGTAAARYHQAHLEIGAYLRRLSSSWRDVARPTRVSGAGK